MWLPSAGAGDRVSGLAHGDHERDLNTIDSRFQHVRLAFDRMDTSTAAGWADVARRLETIDRPLEGYRRTLEAGLERGPVAVRQVRGAIAQGRVHAGDGSWFRGVPAQFAASVISSSPT